MISLVSLAASVVSTYIIIKVIWKVWQDSFNLSWMPWLPNVPVIGSAYIFDSDPYKLYKQVIEWTDRLGDIFCVWFSYKPVIFISNVKFVEGILRSQKVITKSSFYDFLLPWLNTGLLTSTGTKWKTRRRLLTPSFHFSILDDFVSIFEEQSEILVQKLRQHLGDPVELQTIVSLATLDVITETSMGIRMNYQNDVDSEYVKAIGVVTEELQFRQKSPWLWPDFIYQFTSAGKRFYKNMKTTHDLTLKVINDRIQMRIKREDAAVEGKKQFFLDLLLNIYDKGEIDVEGIKEEVTTFMFEGHDTTSSGLSFGLWLLSQNPHVQKKLHEAIDEAEQKGGTVFEKARSCKYLEQVLKEVLRLHPPVPVFGRVVEEDLVINGREFKKGTELAIISITLHRNPKYWENPNDFVPERFADDQTVKRNPYSTVSFSAGPRNCIGQKFAMNNEKVMLYSIMKNFQLLLVEGEVEQTVDIIHKSQNGIWVKFVERK